MVKRIKHTMSFDTDERFNKFVERRAASLGVTKSEMIRTAILFDAMLDCDGEAFNIMMEKAKDKTLGVYKAFAMKLGIVS